MKKLCELLGDRFREKSITASAVDPIRSMAGGNAAHRASALKLALRNGRPGEERSLGHSTVPLTTASSTVPATGLGSFHYNYNYYDSDSDSDD